MNWIKVDFDSEIDLKVLCNWSLVTLFANFTNVLTVNICLDIPRLLHLYTLKVILTNFHDVTNLLKTHRQFGPVSLTNYSTDSFFDKLLNRMTRSS